jgi:hypothetical protein
MTVNYAVLQQLKRGATKRPFSTFRTRAKECLLQYKKAGKGKLFHGKQMLSEESFFRPDTARSESGGNHRRALTKDPGCRLSSTQRQKERRV